MEKKGEMGEHYKFVIDWKCGPKYIKRCVLSHCVSIYIYITVSFILTNTLLVYRYILLLLTVNNERGPKHIKQHVLSH